MVAEQEPVWRLVSNQQAINQTTNQASKCAVCDALQGKLAQLSQLIQAMSFLPGGLASVMAAYRDAFLRPAAVAAAAAAAAATSSTAKDSTSNSSAGKLTVRTTAAAKGSSMLGPDGTKHAAGSATSGVNAGVVAGGANAAAEFEEPPPSVEELIGALAIAAQELPVWESTAVEQVCVWGARRGGRGEGAQHSH